MPHVHAGTLPRVSEATLTIAIFNESTSWALPASLVDRIRAEAPEGITIRQATNRTRLVELLPESDYLIGFPLTEEQVLQATPRLKWVQLTNSPGDAVAPLLAAIRRGVRISSAASMRAPQVAEHAVAMSLALVRRIDAAVRAQDEHRWAQHELASSMRTLMDLTVGIVAVGAVGQEIAQRLKPFGVHIIATRRNTQIPYLHVDEMLPPERLTDLMQRSDVVIVAAPRLPATTNIIAKRELWAMKSTAYLVDVSRGGVVDQEALIDALRRSKLAGAGLDVFAIEPLPPDSPLWTMPNVIVTPHIGSTSPDYWNHAAEIVSENLKRIVEDKPLVDEVTLDWLSARPLAYP